MLFEAANRRGSTPQKNAPPGRGRKRCSHTSFFSDLTHHRDLCIRGERRIAVVIFSEAKPALSLQKRKSVCGTSQPQKTTGCTRYQRRRALTTKPIRKNLPGPHLKNEGVSPLYIHPLHRKVSSPSPHKSVSPPNRRLICRLLIQPNADWGRLEPPFPVSISMAFKIASSLSP